jgi:uncharacterized repeat protein (TIGR01451 family)/fimbrial isopeptide formation D2 family protein
MREVGKNMKKQNILIVTLVITTFLISSMFSVVAINKSPTSVNSLEVVKEVYNGEEWVDSINANIGDIVEFRITVTYHNLTDPANSHYAEQIVIKDFLPPCLDYETGTADPFEPVVDGKNLTWNLGLTTLHDGESYVITFSAEVISAGTNINTATARAYEHCCNIYIEGSGTATVNVIALRPDIAVEKYVWDGNCFWVKETSKYAGEIVTFRIVVENTGECDLYNILIEDTLSDSLDYVVNSATLNGDPYEPVINGKNLTWTWNTLAPEETLEIIFNATVVGLPCDVDTNWVYVEAEDSCATIVHDEDSAKVHINGMCMEKEVWDKDLKAWMESIDASVGETVRFRITIYYYGPKKLYNIKVTDVLPECFAYADNAIPKEPVVTNDTLFWDLSDSQYNLLDGGKLIIEFDAEVTGGLCDECVNWAYVIANECSGRTFEGQDSATVYVKCDFTADAGGPYSGDIDEEIQIKGSAADGNSPYIFEWDLDDDGEFDDATGATITHSWSKAGSYIIRLKVTDDDDKTAQDYAVVNIEQGENNPPNKPSKPRGQSSGKIGATYTYNSSATDPDGDQVYYMWDWADGTNSGWLGPYDSGKTVEASHKWTIRGSFSIKVKARDHPALEESVWSDTLPISMPKSKLLLQNSAFLKMLNKLLDMFPALAKILNL